MDKAHRQGVKVYAAINTLMFDDEFSELENTVRFIDEAGADAVIVQDMGAAQLIKRTVPRLHLHASTQMTVTSASGAEFARRQGFTRVVLPRELSLEEIRNITSKVDIETEVFVHGALCVCLSGQCLLSAFLGGRSGNRGLCAQPCRLNYKCADRENVLSLKDLSLIDKLKELEQAGVTSAKIEGRMKRPEYVAAAVSQCRAALDGKKADMELLRSVFSRSGFTSAYYDGTFNDMQGVRSKEDTEETPEALKKLREFYRTPYKRFTLDMHIEIKQGTPSKCIFTCDDMTAIVIGETPVPAINRPLTQSDVTERMGKLGGTVFTAGKITCVIDPDLTLSASALNQLRRDGVEKISLLIAEKTK